MGENRDGSQDGALDLEVGIDKRQGFFWRRVLGHHIHSCVLEGGRGLHIAWHIDSALCTTDTLQSSHYRLCTLHIAHSAHSMLNNLHITHCTLWPLAHHVLCTLQTTHSALCAHQAQIPVAAVWARRRKTVMRTFSLGMTLSASLFHLAIKQHHNTTIKTAHLVIPSRNSNCAY